MEIHVPEDLLQQPSLGPGQRGHASRKQQESKEGPHLWAGQDRKQSKRQGLDFRPCKCFKAICSPARLLPATQTKRTKSVLCSPNASFPTLTDVVRQKPSYQAGLRQPSSACSWGYLSCRLTSLCTMAQHVLLRAIFVRERSVM